MADGDETQQAGPGRRRRPPRATLAQVAAIGTEGDRFGRFFVLERLGSGGMGVVIAAYDPDLDRKVAIKVLRPDGMLARTELREQMIREAQAMARLTHPNVVAVHEVGTVERVFYLVMELVDGSTLKDWMAAPQPWREVVRVLCAAGRGLAAAHESGLVHRDFKPHNVLVGRDGRVRVTDFGVVGVAGETDSVAVGTPAYMAPEQHGPSVIDARADQYAFCVTLHEALYGVLPGQPRPERSVPAHVHAAIERGLSSDPAARFASMTELIAHLERDSRGLMLRAGVGVSLVGLAALAVVGWSRPAPEPPRIIDPCADAGHDGIETAWNAVRRAEIESAFHAVRPQLAAETTERVAQRLDRYVAGWREVRASVCARRAEHDIAEPLGCLDRKREQVAALTSVLTRADRTIVPNAVAAVSSLEPPQGCTASSRVPVMTSGAHDGLDRARPSTSAAISAMVLPRRPRCSARSVPARPRASITWSRAPTRISRGWSRTSRAGPRIRWRCGRSSRPRSRGPVRRRRPARSPSSPRAAR